jgi:thiol-disulfide isomerase/thioredoxin
MKKPLLLAAAALAVFSGCNRSGVIDATASAPAASGPAGAGNTYHKNPTPDRIAHGQEVNLQDHIVPGKTTIFDFTSEYCPPCRLIAPYLHKLHATRDDIVVVEVDINRPGVGSIDFGSQVARQYNINSIPAFKIYGPNGRLMAEGDDATNQVHNLLR